MPESNDDTFAEHSSLAELAAIERQETVLAQLLGARVTDPVGPTTDVGWEIAPDGLTNVLRAIHDRYGNPPVYVAENGAAFTDDRRRACLDARLRAAHEAIRAGVDLRGWHVWSLMDDADTRFGLVHVDHESHARTIKSSGYWYRDVIAANGLSHPGTD